MSIIYDALKKVQGSEGQNINVKLHSSGDPKRRHKIYLIYVLVSFIGIIGAKIFFSAFISPRQIPSGAHKVSGLIPSSKPLLTYNDDANKTTDSLAPLQKIDLNSIPEEPLNQEPGTFVLSGVFFTDNEGYALVNNRIVKENDMIGGAKVVRVTLEEVELRKVDPR